MHQARNRLFRGCTILTMCLVIGLCLANQAIEKKKYNVEIYYFKYKYLCVMYFIKYIHMHLYVWLNEVPAVC